MFSYPRKLFAAERIAAVLLCLVSVTAAADDCDKLPLPTVTLKRLQETVSLDTRYGYKEVTHLASDLARPESRVLGLTRGTATVRFEVKSSSYIDPSGRWECTSPQLVVSIGYNPMTIYIAREFPKGSCAYNEIYQHELRHVKTYQDHLTSIEKEMAETLRRRFATGSPWRGPVGQTSMVLQRELDQRWLPYLKREIGNVESSQALIDTPDEYSRVSDSCNGEIRRLTR